MMSDREELEFLRPHLTSVGALSVEQFERLAESWTGSSEASFISYLAQVGIIDRSTARTLDAIRKGYLQVPLAAVMKNIAARPEALRVAAAETPRPRPSEVAPAPQAVAKETSVAMETRVATETRVSSEGRPPQNIPEVGARVGKYVLQERIGQGSSGVVFRAFHEALGVPVAIKILDTRRLARLSTEGLAKALTEEGRLLHRLRHPNIISVLDLDLIDGVPYIVFEYGGPINLEDFIATTERVSPDRVARIGIDVARALEAASEQGLIHRDVKPANILMTKTGAAKLADFGLAIHARWASDAARGFTGTPSYIAPEQILDSSGVDLRADMYALGATLYHAAAGRPPFVSTRLDRLIDAVLHQRPRRIRELAPQFDPGLERVILRLLEKDPGARFGAWREVVEALTRASEALERPREPDGPSIDLDILIGEPVEEEAQR